MVRDAAATRSRNVGGVERRGPPNRLQPCHQDLGIEHLLVDSGRLVGVIDWTDAALADPARDLGLLLRDLGRPALRATGVACPDLIPGAASRVLFHARCGALADLAHGMRTGQGAYVGTSLAAVNTLF